VKGILVASDGSESAHRAVDYAAEHAKALGVELVIANVIGGYGLPEGVLQKFSRGQDFWLKELLESQSASLLTEARSRVRQAGLTLIRLESRDGEVAATLIQIARDVDADVIVVGKRGAGRAAGLLLGSVSQKLVSLAPLPVTVVP
jgi:nucleotide-binding universal stress UspA family protein